MISGDKFDFQTALKKATNKMRRPPAVERQPIAYGYCRVSTGRQQLGMDAQERAIADYFKSRLSETHINGGTYKDPGISAKTPFRERAAGSKLNALLQPGDVVIVAKMDRAFRSLKDFAMQLEIWKQMGVYLKALDIGIDTSTDVGELVAGIMVCVAQWERKRIGSRTREGLDQRRRNGLRISRRAPRGTKFEGNRIVENPTWFEEAELIAKLHEEDGLSFMKISWIITEKRCQELNIPFKKSHFFKHRVGDTAVRDTYNRYKVMLANQPQPAV